MHFKTETYVVQYLIDAFFLTLTVRRPFYRKDKKLGGSRLLSETTEALYAELNESEEAVNRSYSAAGDFLQYIYSVIMAKNHQKIRSRCLVH